MNKPSILSRRSSAAFAALLLGVVPATMRAEHFVNHDSPLIPVGLRPGDSFHLVLATVCSKLIGGSASVCAAAGVDLSGEISRRIAPHFPTGFAVPKVSIIPAANEQVLRGTLAIAAGIFETYPRYSPIRWFPEPDWAKENPDSVPPTPWLDERR